jgi:aspartyl/asparaginyl beta-hydroxylase (cupin superfamily)
MTKHDIDALEGQTLLAERQGDRALAAKLWAEILALDPQHYRALMAKGRHDAQRGDLEAARLAFLRAAPLNRTDPTAWIQVAQIHRQRGEDALEEEALFEALKVDASDLLALLMRGQLFERQGKTHQAAKAFGGAAVVAPPMDRLRPDLRLAVAHASTYRAHYAQTMAAFLDERLESGYRDSAGEDLERFQLAVDIMLGRKRRHDSKPAQFYVPGLLPVEFFPREDFPWLDAIEAGTDRIRDEFLEVLKSDEGFVPYLTYPLDQPLNQWVELNNSPRWSGYHLIKDGAPVPAGAAKCPETMRLLAGAPQPDQPGRTPVALFSLLKPRTHIPPHNGVSNARLLVHVPLIIPESCGFRVGNQTRQWVPGKAWVFDDSVEHEAWNNSDKLRVILIFDIWHPSLTAAERTMIATLSSALNEFGGAPGESDA